jgi:hypothetical protein
MGLYRLQSAAGSYPQEIQAKISELADSLEKDIAESAKQNGFYPEYAAQLKAVKNALLTSRQPAGIPSQTNFGRPAKNFRTLVYWAHGGVCSSVGQEHCRAEEKKLIMDFARECGMLPPLPQDVFKVVRAAPRPVRQIEATEKLAKAPLASEIRRREIIASGAKTSEL